MSVSTGHETCQSGMVLRLAQHSQSRRSRPGFAARGFAAPPPRAPNVAVSHKSAAGATRTTSTVRSSCTPRSCSTFWHSWRQAASGSDAWRTMSLAKSLLTAFHSPSDPINSHPPSVGICHKSWQLMQQSEILAGSIGMERRSLTSNTIISGSRQIAFAASESPRLRDVARPPRPSEVDGYSHRVMDIFIAALQPWLGTSVCHHCVMTATDDNVLGRLAIISYHFSTTKMLPNLPMQKKQFLQHSSIEKRLIRVSLHIEFTNATVRDGRF